jgi:hypothetical protein
MWNPAGEKVTLKVVADPERRMGEARASKGDGMWGTCPRVISMYGKSQ